MDTTTATVVRNTLTWPLASAVVTIRSTFGPRDEEPPAGVREPRRPKSGPPTLSVALDLDTAGV